MLSVMILSNIVPLQVVQEFNGKAYCQKIYEAQRDINYAIAKQHTAPMQVKLAYMILANIVPSQVVQVFNEANSLKQYETQRDIKYAIACHTDHIDKNDNIRVNERSLE